MKTARRGEIHRPRGWPTWACGVVAACGLFVAALPVAAQVGQVIDTRGASIVERQGQSPRLLGAGEDLAERDVIRVSRDGYTMLRLRDNTRVTLRPNTVFRVEAYKESRPENMLLGLLRGGMRVLTGLIGRRNPSAVKFQTALATIGIRGTEFDARLCAGDCEEEAGAIPTTVAQLPGVIARVVEMKGVAVAATSSGGSRQLAPGAALYEGDGVATGGSSYAVLAFVDGSRITLAEHSSLALPLFRFDAEKLAGYAVLNHIDGGARVKTGAIAKQGPEHYRFFTPLGEIQPRGSGWDSLKQAVGSAIQEGGDKTKDALDKGKDAVDEKIDEGKKDLQNAANKTKEEMDREAQALKDAIGRQGSKAMTDAKNVAAECTSDPAQCAAKVDISAVEKTVLKTAQDDQRQDRRNAADSGRGLQQLSDDAAADKDAIKDAADKKAAEAKAAADKKTAEAKVAADKAAAEAKAAADGTGPLDVTKMPSGPGNVSTPIPKGIDEQKAGRARTDAEEKIAAVDKKAAEAKSEADKKAAKAKSDSDQARQTERARLTTQNQKTEQAKSAAEAGVKQATDGATKCSGDPAKCAAVAKAAAQRAANNKAAGQGSGQSTGGEGEIRRDGEKGDTGSERTRTAGSNFGNAGYASVRVWDGSVDVKTKDGGTMSLDKGGTFSVMLAEPPGPVTNTSTVPRPDRVKIDPDLFGAKKPTVESGVYIWVREGTVTLGKDGSEVAVAAGNAAVATFEKVQLLDTVPSFMRFDQTPLPIQAASNQPVAVFRAPDGSVANVCKP